MKKLFIDYHPKRVCVAMTENNELKEYYVEKATKPKIVGNIYKGKVVNTLQGMKAAFVNIGLEKNAFLYAGETLVDKTTLGDGALVMPQKLNVSPGDRIMCQVVKDYFGTQYFTIVRGQMTGVAPKPAAEGTNALLQALHADPASTLYVGDSNVDVETAHNANLPCCGAVWGFRTREELNAAGAEYLAENSDELYDVIMK